MNKKKGVFLIYVLFAAILLSVFLLTAVGEMHNNFFLTKRFNGENRAYWAAEAGIQYCEYKLKTNLGWPFLNNNDKASETFGNFTITSTKNGEDGYYIHGISNDEDEDEEEFHIYFSKKNAKTLFQNLSMLQNTNINIVPKNFPNSELQYCSYNSFTSGDINNIYETQNIYQENASEYSNTVITVGNNHTATISSPGIYIISDGRSKIYQSVIEKMLVVDNNNSISGGLYAGGNIDIELKGKSSRFKIAQTSNLKPEIYCKNTMNVKKKNDITRPNEDYCPSIYTKINGTVYFGDEFNVIDELESTNNFSSKNYSSSAFKKQYGINLKEYTAKNNSFPKLEWNKIQNIEAQMEQKTDATGKPLVKEIASGSYVAIYEKENDAYTLCRLNRNYINRDGTFIKSKFLANKTRLEEDLEVAKGNIDKSIQSMYNDDSLYDTITTTTTDSQGNTTTTTEKVFSEKGKALVNDKDTTDRGLIQEFVKLINGLSPDYKNDNLATKKYILCSPHEKSDIFSIDSIVLKEDQKKIDPKSQETNKTPIITLKESVKTAKSSIPNEEEYFNLFTLSKKLNPSTNVWEFAVDETKSTDLVFAKKNKGTSERVLQYFESLKNGQLDTNEEQSLLENENVGTLYTNGYVAINGKLSGTGQILSGGSVYFRAGSQLNANPYGNPLMHPAENSKLAIYSRGTIKMGVPQSIENLEPLYKKINDVLKNASSYSYYSLTYSALNSNVKITKEDKERVAAYITDDDNKNIPLSRCMEKYYGFTYNEAYDYIDDIIRTNVKYDSDTYKYIMPSDIQIPSYQSPSGFSGIIYACGGFKTDANLGNLTINGVLITYGGNPSPNSIPGDGSGFFGLNNKELLGINSYGGIEIKNCRNFSIIYNSTDLNNFVRLCNEQDPINLSCIYYNKL